MTYREFIGWITYYKIQPFGDDWKQTAILGNLLSIVGSDRKLKKPIEEHQIIPYHKDQRENRLLRLKHKLDQQRRKEQER